MMTNDQISIDGETENIKVKFTITFIQIQLNFLKMMRDKYYTYILKLLETQDKMIYWLELKDNGQFPESILSDIVKIQKSYENYLMFEDLEELEDEEINIIYSWLLYLYKNKNANKN